MSLPAAGFPGKVSEKKERQMMPSPATTPKALSEQPDSRGFHGHPEGRDRGQALGSWQGGGYKGPPGMIGVTDVFFVLAVVGAAG